MFVVLKWTFSPVSWAYSRLDLTAPTRNMGPRKLLKEGTVMKKSEKRLRAFLCSGVLVLTDENGSKGTEPSRERDYKSWIRR